jgi:hypothetical protein
MPQRAAVLVEGGAQPGHGSAEPVAAFSDLDLCGAAFRPPESDGHILAIAPSEPGKGAEQDEKEAAPLQHHAFAADG